MFIVYLDIGEVFPMVSQDGQEKVITDALALCPSEKLTWSTGKRSQIICCRRMIAKAYNS